jgi:hypothetical protein
LLAKQRRAIPNPKDGGHFGCQANAMRVFGGLTGHPRDAKFDMAFDGGVACYKCLTAYKSMRKPPALIHHLDKRNSSKDFTILILAASRFKICQVTGQSGREYTTQQTEQDIYSQFPYKIKNCNLRGDSWPAGLGLFLLSLKFYYQKVDYHSEPGRLEVEDRLDSTKLKSFPTLSTIHLTIIDHGPPPHFALSELFRHSNDILQAK